MKTEKNKYNIVILIIAILLFNSCKNECSSLDNAKKIMGERYGNKLIFSDRLKIMNNDDDSMKVSDRLINPSSKYRIVHFFDADCSTCVEQLQKINDNTDLFAKSNKLKVILIASTPHESKLEYVISKSNLHIPVYYINGYKIFKKENKFPLDDTLYDTMLINSSNEILLFGAFFDNEKAEKMFMDIVNCSTQ